MNKPTTITFKASHHAEAEKSVGALCIKGQEEGSWSTLKWFPRKYCTFSEVQPYNKIEITAPLWLLELMNLSNKVTIVKEF